MRNGSRALALLALLGCAWAALDRCAFCTFVVREAELVANSTNVARVVAALDQTCHSLFHHNGTALRACLALAAEAGQSLAHLPDLVSFNDDYPVNVVCAILFRGVCKLPCCADAVAPEQVYITFGARNDQVRVTWVTLNATQSLVEWGVGGQVGQWNATGSIATYTAGGWVGTIHHASMDGLKAGQQYSYRVGDGSHWSSVASFVNPLDTYPVSLVTVADMGSGNNSMGTMRQLQRLLSDGTAQWILHVGDVAYADGNQIIWDQYGRQVESVVRTAPYVLLPGNHEIAFNFSSFRHRYPMAASPAPGDALYWSFDRAGVRFVAVDGESVVDTPLVTDGQLAWLQNVLQDGAARKRSGELQWIVVSIHRPLYCSSDESQCKNFATYLRMRLEQLFQKYLVDLVLQAHKHNYERSTPLFAGSVMAPGTAPIYVVNGIGGSREGNSGFESKVPTPPWRVVAYTREPGAKEDLWGYGLLNIEADQLTWTMYSDDAQNPLDTFTVQPRHQ